MASQVGDGRLRGHLAALPRRRENSRAASGRFPNRRSSRPSLGARTIAASLPAADTGTGGIPSISWRTQSG